MEAMFRESLGKKPITSNHKPPVVNIKGFIKFQKVLILKVDPKNLKN